MSEVFCMECGQSFDTRRSLHAHIKAHCLSLGEYYVKFFPKFDLLTRDPIPFKNYEDYVRTDFRHKKNMYQWLQQIDPQEAADYCRRVFTKHLSEKQYVFAPNHLYMMTHPRLPKKEFFSEEQFVEMVSAENLTYIQNQKLVNRLDLTIPEDLLILQDTREQKPLRFANESRSMKLDFGDYTAAGDYYSYIYVDRKAEDDFKNTVTSGFDRFCRELERARQFGAYVFVVIESDFLTIYKNYNKTKRGNMVYVWEGMRRLITSYSDVCQFVLTGSRENSEKLIPYLLVHGSDLKNVDLQFEMERGHVV